MSDHLADPADLERVKQQISGKLMAIDGVAGVGVGAGRIQVYLAREDHRVRDEVERVMQAEAPDTPRAFVVTGEFRAFE